MGDENKNEDDSSYAIWVLVPLAALLIPIIAVSEGNALLMGAIAAAILGGAAAVVARSLMDHRHRLRLKEMEAQHRLVTEERRLYNEANRILENDQRLGELRDAIGNSKTSPAPDAAPGTEEQTH